MSEAHPTPNLCRTVGKLLRLRWVIFISGFKRARLRGKIGTIILALLVVGGLAFAFWISWLMLGLLRSPRLSEFTGDLTAILEAPAGGHAAFIGILITSFGVLLQALYLATWIFCFSHPVPIRAVFITVAPGNLTNFGLILPSLVLYDWMSRYSRCTTHWCWSSWFVSPGSGISQLIGDGGGAHFPAPGGRSIGLPGILPFTC
jgi:hypothetical protein